MTKEFDYKQALLDPESVFEAPEDVLTCDALSKEQKIEVLRRWEYDATEVEVAEEEGMQDGVPSRLREVLLALDKLTGGIDVTHSPPTKQGGV